MRVLRIHDLIVFVEDVRRNLDFHEIPGTVSRLSCGYVDVVSVFGSLYDMDFEHSWTGKLIEVKATMIFISDALRVI